jgi:hypothetical protein
VGRRDVVAPGPDHGGEGPRFCQLHASVADTEAAGVATAYEQWPISGLGGEMNAVLPTPKHFEQAVGMVSEADIAESSIMSGPDAQQHIESIQAAIDAGYDHVYVHQIGDDQEALFELYREEILPSFS